jgi:hypothetical protein
VKLGNLSLAALIALAGPAVVQADTVYFSQRGVTGIQSITGTIVQETGGLLKITTESGRNVSIPMADVFQIIRDTPPTAGPSDSDLARDTRSTAGHSDFVPVSSQSTTVYHVGIKGGMNISNLNVDPQELEDDNSLQSYAVGAWWGIPVNRRLTIQTEALYSVKGDAESAGGYTASTHMGYIDVPVLAKVGFLHSAPVQPSLFLGPSLAVNLSAKSKLQGNGSDADVDVKDQVRTFDFGLVVGGGVDFQVAERTFGVDLRYSKGLSNVVGEGANGSARNDVIAVMGSIGLQ